MKKLFICAAVIATHTTAAWALDLTEARTRGLVCERADGTLAATSNVDPDVAQLVASVNAGRKAEYKRIASEQNQPMEVAAKLAAEQLRKQGHKACK